MMMMMMILKKLRKLLASCVFLFPESSRQLSWPMDNQLQERKKNN